MKAIIFSILLTFTFLVFAFGADAEGLTLPLTTTSVNSWFDHEPPFNCELSEEGCLLNDYFVKYIGLLWTSSQSSLNNCTLGLNCYNGHNGIDFHATLGTDVLAAAAGSIQSTGFQSGGLGSWIRVWHSARGYTTLSGHLSQILISSGPVVRGSIIGKSGNSGCDAWSPPCGYHLHFSAYDAEVGGNSIDPYGWSGNGKTDQRPSPPNLTFQKDPWPTTPDKFGYLWTTDPPSTSATQSATSWNFLKTSEGWAVLDSTPSDASDDTTDWGIYDDTIAAPNNDKWVLDPKLDPQLVSPQLSAITASQYPTVEIKFSAQGTGQTDTCKVYFSKTSPPSFNAGDVVDCSTSVIKDGTQRIYTANLASDPDYTGTITGIRIDPIVNGDPASSTDLIYFDYIKFLTAPTVSSITPNSGVNTGSVSITSITGTNFVSGAAVKLTKSGQSDITCSGFTLNSSSPAAVDDFNRPDSDTVGNGWSERNFSASSEQIFSNQVRIGKTGENVHSGIWKNHGLLTLPVTLSFKYIPVSGSARPFYLSVFGPAGSPAAVGWGLGIRFKNGTNGPNNYIIIPGNNTAASFSADFSTTKYIWIDYLPNGSNVDIKVYLNTTNTKPATPAATLLNVPKPNDSNASFGFDSNNGEVVQLDDIQWGDSATQSLDNGSCPITGVAAGAWNVVVTNPDGQSGTLANGFTVSLPDTTPPVISLVSSSNITSNSATITWTTDEQSTSQVEYGTTTSYGSQTTLDLTPVTSHSVNLTGLTLNTLYHYRVKSKDAANNEAVSADYTFTTSAAGSWTYEQTFNNLNNGDINGQDSWSGAVQYDVQSTIAHEGTKAVQVNAVSTSKLIERTVPSFTSGQVYFSVRRDTNSVGYFGFYLRNSTAGHVAFIYLKPDGNISAYEGPSQTERIIGSYQANTWYRIGIDYSASTDQYRANINNGTWSQWYQAVAATSEINQIKLYADGNANSYFDFISPGY